MNDVWKMWKKSFDSWENATAAYVEEVLKSPLVLGPSGTLLSEAMKARAKVNDRLADLYDQFFSAEDRKLISPI